MASNSSEETLPKIAKANALVASFKPVAYKANQGYGLLCVFFAGYCEIQTGMSRKTIVYAKKRQGLYHFREIKEELSVEKYAMSSISSFDVWHFRLGHPSSRKIKGLRMLDNSIDCNRHLVCGICPLAKQKQLQFPTSITSSTKSFELIHVDIWEPYHAPSIYGHYYFLTIVDDFTRGSGFVDDHLCKSFSQLVSGDEAQVTSSGVEPGLSSGHMDYGFNEDRDSIGEVSLVLVEQSSVDRTILLQPSPSAQHDISDNENGKYTSFAL
nr:Retrovirus-related Pol polyprotein from transposon TNT 1-94 [Ipomoea batatas]